jgi:16S rRNA (adenine1518-N6/adenine1519-N6)-dimethyltransferase
MKYPPVVIVNEKDEVIGSAMLKDAQAQGIYYRVIAVAVLDAGGRVLLQKRSAGMKIDPGKWDVSAGGHVDEGQTYELAAEQELQEELGITGLQPRGFGNEFLGDCFLKLYTLILPSDAKLKAGAEEVSEVRWFTLEELELLLRRQPADCAEFLKEIYQRAPGVFSPDRSAVRNI